MKEETVSKNRLRGYYYTRGAVSAAWAAAAFTLGTGNPVIAALLLIAYPLWDAAANWIDTRQNGGLARNVSQTVNIVVSLAVTVAVTVAVGQNTSAVFFVFGIWASLTGILQLIVGVQRWKTFGSQWAMVLSGLQSALAGGFFIVQSLGSVSGIAPIAFYAGFGAFYFLLSAILLTVSKRG